MSDTKLDRRGFLAGAAGLTGVALSVGAWKPAFAMEADFATADISAANRNFKVHLIALTLDKVEAASLSFAVGGNATADVINETNAKVAGDVRKHIGQPKFENLFIFTNGWPSKIDVGAWIKDSFSGQPVTKSGSIAAADFNLKVFQKLDFTHALITEVGFPALDAASKDAAKMSIKFAPETTRTSFTQAGNFKLAPITQTANQKWLVSNFKLTLNGLNTSFVSKIDAINVKWDFATSEEGSGLGPLEGIEFPNMKLTMPQARAVDFIKWHNDFVINGNSGPENEKAGSLSFLSTDLKTEFFRLDLSGVGIFDLDTDALTINGAEPNVNVGLYIDKMVFTNQKE